MKKFCLLLLCVSLLAGGCVNPLDPEGNNKTGEFPRELTELEQELIWYNRQFGYELFRRIAENRKEDNILVSPLNVSRALAMPMNGGFGETREVIKEAMALEGMDLQDINRSYRSLMDLLFSLDKHVQIKKPVALWHRKNLGVKDEFVKTSADFLNAEVRSVDTGSNSADDVINEWVSAGTDGHIDHVLDNVSQYMLMYLIDAVYFEAGWHRKFDPTLTYRDKFYPEDGSPVEVDMMVRESEMATYVSEEVQMVEIPYGDSLFTMTLIMPGDSLKSIDGFIEESFTNDRVSDWLRELSVTGTELRIPEFDMEYEQKMKNILSEMGMGHAFGESADFYNISDKDGLYLNEMKHKTLIRVDAKGVNPAPSDFLFGAHKITLDRPFVFMVREINSGAVILMGKMENPSL